MPSIVIVADDGTKFELPEESASFSDLLRGAMEQWTQRHDAATTPSSVRPQTDGADGLALSDEDDSTAEDVGRNWPLGGDDASTCSQLSDFPEEDRYFQGASTFGLKQSVERLLPESGASTSGAADGLRRRQVSARATSEEDDAIRLEDDPSPTAPSSGTETAAAGSSGPPLAAAAAAAAGALSDTDSDRTASIAPDVDSRSHSTSSSQGSVGMAGGMGMGGWTPPRSALPGVVVSPGSGLGAPHQRRDSDGVKVDSSGSSASSGSSTTSSSDSDSDASTSEAEGEEKGAAASEEAAPVDLPGPRDNEDDSVTPSTLSEEEEERGLGGNGSGVDDAGSNEVEARYSGTSSNSTGARRSVSAPQDGETLGEEVTAGRSDAHSNASTPEILSPSQRDDVVGEEEEVGGELRLGSPLDGEGSDGKPSRASVKGGEAAGNVKSPFAGSPKGMKKGTGSGTERVEGHPHAGVLVSSTPTSTNTSVTSSSSRSGGRKSGTGGVAGKSPSMSLRERLEDASLKHRSDSDSSEDEDAVVERVRHLGVAAAYSNHRDPRTGLASPYSSDERGSAGRRSDGSGGRRSDGSNGAADSVSSVRKAYTLVVNAAEPLEDDEDEDDIGMAPIEDVDGDAFDCNAVHTPREDLAGAVPMRSPVDAGMPSSIAATLAKGNSHKAQNFHQRAPVMIGVGEECVHLLSSEGHATIRTPKEGLEIVPTAPASGAGAPTDSPSPSPSHADVEKVAVANGPASTQTAGASTSHKSSITKRVTSKEDADEDQDEEDTADRSDEDDEDVDAILYKGAVISKHKIVVDLVHSNTNSTPSQGVTPRTVSDGAATTAAILGGGGGVEGHAGSSSAPTPGNDTAPPLLALPVESVRLCVAYLQHFATNVMSFEAEFGERPSRGGGLCRSTSYTSYDSHNSSPAAQDRAKKESATRPSELPMPLTQPLVALLTDWETDFLFTTVLQLPAASKEQAQRAMQTCPNLDMRYPGMYLQKEPSASELRDALRMPAPEKAGLARLKSLLITAKHLQIDALVQLLTAWLADFMLRVCYSGADNFEAAHLIRFCFQVQNDFNRREMEYLKIENEWPANEEE